MNAATLGTSIPSLRPSDHADAPESVDASLSLGAAFVHERNELGHRGVDRRDRQLGRDEARYQAAQSESVREPLLSVIPAFAWRAGPVTAAARMDNDELAVAEQ